MSVSLQTAGEQLGTSWPCQDCYTTPALASFLPGYPLLACNKDCCFFQLPVFLQKIWHLKKIIQHTTIFLVLKFCYCCQVVTVGSHHHFLAHAALPHTPLVYSPWGVVLSELLLSTVVSIRAGTSAHCTLPQHNNSKECVAQHFVIQCCL